MTDPSRDELLLAMVREALQSQRSAAGEHVVEDEDLLYRWSLGEITAKEHAAILKHLARCGECAGEVADMIRAGALKLPPVEEEGAAQEEPTKDEVEPTSAVEPGLEEAVAEAAELAPAEKPRPAPAPVRWRRLVVTGVAVAAAVLVAVGIWVFPRWQMKRELASARDELESGNPAAAFDRVDKLLGRNLPAPLRTEAQSLLRSAGYRVAERAFSDGDYPQVGAIVERVRQHVDPDAALWNLALQSRRDRPAKLSLEYASAVIDYDYRLDGSLVTMAIPTYDQKKEDLRRDFNNAVDAHPDDAALRLNFGQFLLSLRQFPQAKQQFKEVLRRDERNLLARLGLGLAEFQGRQYEAAFSHFERALEIDPGNLPAHLDAAACLKQLDRTTEAQALWQKAYRLTDDPDLKREIGEQLAGVDN